MAPDSIWIRKGPLAVQVFTSGAVVLKVGFESFLDFSLVFVELNAKHHLPLSRLCLEGH